jgi:FMN reductase
VSIVFLIGSATPPGRTHAIADQLVAALRSHGTPAALELLDLALLRFDPCDGRPLDGYDVTVRDAVAKVSGAGGVLIASPVYRATYTGVLKNFLDILPVDPLRDKPVGVGVGVAVVGGSLHHYLGVDLGLRAMLAWFDALALPTSVYLTGANFDEAKQPTSNARAQLAALAESVVALMGPRFGRRLGPAPLAAR